MGVCTCDCHKEDKVVHHDEPTKKLGFTASILALLIFGILSATIMMIMMGYTTNFDEQNITLVWVIISNLFNLMVGIGGYLYGSSVHQQGKIAQGRK